MLPRYHRLCNFNMVNCMDAFEPSERERIFRIAALSNFQDLPKCVWSQPVCPWDYSPVTKKKSKKSWNAELQFIKNSKGLNADMRKKQTGNNTPRDKKKVPKKSFTYYHDIGEYIKEYKKITKAISSDLKTCACHGGYTQKDVDKMYEALPKIKKRDSKKAKVTVKANTSSSTTIIDKVKDEVEDEAVRATTPLSASRPTNIINQTQKKAFKTELSRGIFKQGPDAGDGLEDFVQHHLGRDFFMNHPYLGKKGSSCPVVKIMLPEAHDVRRVSRCGNESPKKVPTIDSPALTNPLIRDTNFSQASNETKERSYNRTGLFEAVSPDDLQSAPSPAFFDKPERLTKGKTLSAKVRDFRPFSRNGIATRVSKVMKDKQRKRASSDPNVPARNFKKQEIPWKVLRYLGYNPSMRKYLHDIYSPVDYKQSKSPLLLSSRKCFNPVNTAKSTTVGENRPGRYPSIYQKSNDIGVSHILAGDDTILDKSDSNILVEKYLNIRRQERPKIAILPKLDTVVKPKVMRKFIVS